MSPDCAVCGVETSVSDACPYCGRPVCEAHRSADDHACPGTDAGTTTGWRVDLDGSESGNPSDGVPDRHAGETDAWALFRPGLGLAVLTVLLVAASVGTVAYLAPVDDELDAASTAGHVESVSNEAREEEGVGVAVHDDALAAVAREHSRDMRDRGFVDHENPDGAGPEDRVRAAGLDCRPGENVYRSPRGALATSERALADHVVGQFLDSPGHRRTVLDGQYQRQGVGVAVGDDAVYVTQLFC